ncbi:prepilin-type N-terminal cleavage/methylation domain-containing protein [Beggiatoa alba B18LD]|uniref:Prepilin-type N-terminal cleavage/methylation domain-containing protein n=1 Tax=Beggiatoa alba B18LD TaxID=395493 RepID=I3CJU5_9GAMM|nr:PilW family protein [Beggiatoa alba]EIJ43888.1 prepilin-type N-terminal cleavage/methylation domain-containing protein [Beggiatoa alba B18LD]
MDNGIMNMKSKQKGFSLIEIMVALTISLILLAGVLTIFASSKRTYSLQAELSTLQDNARFVMDDMTFGLRMSGYYGCSTRSPTNLNTGARIEVENNVAIKDATGVSTVSKNTASSISKSDALTIRYYGSNLTLNPASLDLLQTTSAASLGTVRENLLVEQNTINTAFANPNANSFTLDASSVKPAIDSTIVISDCGGSLAYKVASVTGNTVAVKDLDGSTTTFRRTYAWPIEVFTNVTDSVRYEVRGVDNNGDGDANDPEDGYTLYKTDPNCTVAANCNMIPFIEGVQNMQVRLGLDTTGDGVPNQYIEPTANVDANRIIAVKITLLMRTANKRFDLGDTTEAKFTLDPAVIYEPNATANLTNEIGYRHRLFTSVIRIRNS